jgi:arylsulfatase A-like enzyme/Flp pilus assembly protein TadD
VIGWSPVRRLPFLPRIILCILSGILPLGLPASAQTAADKTPPDVYLITIDTLRADHVGCYGYKQVETPALDALAADGVRFSEAFTHSPITNTSHTSIMTGLLPSVHGVTDFGVPLAPQHVTAAELLKKRGYQTAAFIGAVILDSNALAPGLDRGFDFYDNFPKADTAAADGKTTDAKNTDLKNTGPKNKERWDRVERRGMEVVQHAEAWFDQHRTGPHFVWVHLFDPHDPYEPPPPFSEKYKDHLYDGEIAYADSAVANWIAYLKKAGVYDNAIIIVSGDHGEGLGEHGEETHGLFLYDATLHIPLLLKTPRGAAAPAYRGVVIDAQVRTTDILPTILDATCIAAPPELNGESLFPLLEKSSGEKKSDGTNERELFGETDYPLRWGWAPLRALRTENAKLIEAPRPELYDLHADPKELKNLYADGAKLQSLQAEMAKWEAKLPAPNNFAKSEKLPDPKDKIEVQNLLHNAMLASDDNRLTDARRFLEKAVELDPSSPNAFLQLGEIELAAGDYAKAATHLKRASQLGSDDQNAAYEAGEAMEKSGDFSGARDALEASLKLAPAQMPARLLLGHVYLQLKDAKNAADQFEAALLVDSENPDGRLGLAEAQIQQSDFAGALADLEALTKSDPRNATTLRLLARAYRGLGRVPDAKRVEAQAAALDKK